MKLFTRLLDWLCWRLHIHRHIIPLPWRMLEGHGLNHDASMWVADVMPGRFRVIKTKRIAGVFPTAKSTSDIAFYSVREQVAFTLGWSEELKTTHDGWRGAGILRRS